MRFGVAILPEHPWAVAEPVWRDADELGFDHLWTFDHIVWGGLPESPWYAAVPTLVAAATVTSRARLGTFVSTPNNHHPVQFMREVLALDDISGGRFLLGIGAGGDIDSRIAGVELTPRERSARFHEFTNLLDRLLSEDRVDVEGPWYTARDVQTRPGPVRGLLDGHRVPLLVAANGPRAIRLAAARGDGWLTYGRADAGDGWWRDVATASRRVDEALDAVGRERHTLSRYLDLDAGPTFSLTSAAIFEDAVGRAAELGFTDVITHWPRPSSPYDGTRATLERVVSDVLPRWR